MMKKPLAEVFDCNPQTFLKGGVLKLPERQHHWNMIAIWLNFLIYSIHELNEQSVTVKKFI